MAVYLFFGLPGCGKTTICSKIAYDAVTAKKRKYQNVYSNIPLNIAGVTTLDNDCIGKYVLENALVLIDEATLFADSRDHKNFTKGQLTFFLEHRHFNCDIFLFTQQWDGVDRKIRVITDRVYYVYKDWLTGAWFSRYYRIPYGIIIPDPKSGNDKLGEIIQGYCKPNFFVRLFSPWVFRPKYYKFFDSWSRPRGFLPLPSTFRPYGEITEAGFIDDQKDLENFRKKEKRTKAIILLRSLPMKVSRQISRSWDSVKSFFVKIFADRHVQQ